MYSGIWLETTEIWPKTTETVKDWSRDEVVIADDGSGMFSGNTHPWGRGLSVHQSSLSNIFRIYGKILYFPQKV